MNLAYKNIIKETKGHGYEIKIIPSSHMEDLKNEIKSIHAKGIINEVFFERYLKGFKFDYSDELSDAKSIIIIAIPQPATVLSFSWKGHNHKVIVPPSYIYEETDKQAASILKNMSETDNFNFTRAALPLKLLSVRSGLSIYGRNNI